MHHNVIAVYTNHDNAVNAVSKLIEQGFPSKHISLMGKASADDDFETKNSNTAAKGVGIGAASGTLLGILTGVGLFAIPGVGFLYGAGAIAGAIAGLDIGAIGGGIVSTLLLGGEKKEIASIYDDNLKEGKTLLVFRGSDDENNKAMEALEQIGGCDSIQHH